VCHSRGSFARVDPAAAALDAVRTERHHGASSAIAISPDGQRAALGWWDGTVEVWDLDQLQILRRARLTRPVNAVGFVDDAAVAVGREGELRVLMDSGHDIVRRHVVVSPQVLATSTGSAVIAVADEWGNMHVLELVRPARTG
jgi:WD40 repeat protein